MSYSEKLKDPRWQKKRLKIFERDNWKCRFCQSEERTLHVHHKKYIDGFEPWDYDDDLLLTFCYICHNADHEMNGALTKFIQPFKIEDTTEWDLRMMDNYSLEDIANNPNEWGAVSVVATNVLMKRQLSRQL